MQNVYGIKQINRTVPILPLFVLYLLISSTNAFSTERQMEVKDVGEYSHKLYEDRDEARVICGDFRVIAFSDYKVRGKHPNKQYQKQYQGVIRQYFEFTDMKSGDKKMVVATTMDVLDGFSKEFLESSDESKKQFFLEDSYLDGQAFDWACLKGNNGHYLAIGYSNGGRCHNCEWVEIMNRKGEVVDRSIKDTNADNDKDFNKTLSKLGLPPIFAADPIFKHFIIFRRVWLDNKED